MKLLPYDLLCICFSCVLVSSILVVGDDGFRGMTRFRPSYMNKNDTSKDTLSSSSTDNKPSTSSSTDEKPRFSIGLGVLAPSYSQNFGSDGKTKLDVDTKSDGSFSYSLSNLNHETRAISGSTSSGSPTPYVNIFHKQGPQKTSTRNQRDEPFQPIANPFFRYPSASTTPAPTRRPEDYPPGFSPYSYPYNPLVHDPYGQNPSPPPSLSSSYSPSQASSSYSPIPSNHDIYSQPRDQWVNPFLIPRVNYQQQASSNIDYQPQHNNHNYRNNNNQRQPTDYGRTPIDLYVQMSMAKGRAFPSVDDEVMGGGGYSGGGGGYPGGVGGYPGGGGGYPGGGFGGGGMSGMMGGGGGMEDMMGSGSGYGSGHGYPSMDSSYGGGGFDPSSMGGGGMGGPMGGFGQQSTQSRLFSSPYEDNPYAMEVPAEMMSGGGSPYGGGPNPMASIAQNVNFSPDGGLRFGSFGSPLGAGGGGGGGGLFGGGAMSGMNRGLFGSASLPLASILNPFRSGSRISPLFGR